MTGGDGDGLGGPGRPSGWSSLTAQLQNPRPPPPRDPFPPLAESADSREQSRRLVGAPASSSSGSFSSGRKLSAAGRPAEEFEDARAGFSSNGAAAIAFGGRNPPAVGSSSASAPAAAAASSPPESSSSASFPSELAVGSSRGPRIPGGSVGNSYPYRVQSGAYRGRLRSFRSEGGRVVADDPRSEGSGVVTGELRMRGAQSELSTALERRDKALADDGGLNSDIVKPTMSDGRSAIRDADKDEQRQQMDDAGGGSTAASSNFRPPPEPEGEETDEYHTLRADALKESRARDKLSRGASQAFIRGDHKKAKALSKQAKEKQLLAKKLHDDAASEILRRRNNSGSVDFWRLDLHGLHAAEAVAAVRDRLALVESGVAENQEPRQVSDSREAAFPQQRGPVTSDASCPDRECSMHDSFQSFILRSKLLSVITGVGSHSQHGAALPTAVKTFLINKGYHFEEPLPGVVSVRPKLRFSVQ